MRYVIRCMTPEEYSTIDETQLSDKISISIFNSYHKDFLNKLDKMYDLFDCIVFEYPRKMTIEVGWIAARVKSGRLREVKFEMLGKNYISPGVNEILVVGEGYDDK